MLNKELKTVHNIELIDVDLKKVSPEKTPDLLERNEFEEIRSKKSIFCTLKKMKICFLVTLPPILIFSSIALIVFSQK